MLFRSVEGYGGALALHNLDKVEDLRIEDVSHISLTDIKKLKTLRKLDVRSCNFLFPEELDGSIDFCSVESLCLDVSHLTSKSPSKVLNCFLSSSTLQILRFSSCTELVLVPVENGVGIQEDNSSLQSLTIFACGKLFCRWPLGEAGGGAQTIYPFPASLRKLDVWDEPSMKSMALLSNLTSLTSLILL